MLQDMYRDKDDQNSKEKSFSTGCMHSLIVLGMIAVAGFISTRMPERLEDVYMAISLTVILGLFGLLRGWSTGNMNPVVNILVVILLVFNWRELPLVFRVQWNVAFVAVAAAGYLLGLWLRKRRLRRATQQV